VLDPADVGTWLDPKSTAAQLETLLRPYPAELMMAEAVSTRVNSPRNNDEGCVAPIG
jgi:putative SOS response-associated peptidase YedK